MVDGLSGDQMRAVAQKIRQRYSPPRSEMNPAQYVSHEAMDVLAWALESVADDSDAEPASPLVEALALRLGKELDVPVFTSAPEIEDGDLFTLTSGEVTRTGRIVSHGKGRVEIEWTDGEGEEGQ